MESDGETKRKTYGKDGNSNAFCWSEKDDPTELHTIVKFPDLEAIQAFGSNEELTEERRQAGAIIKFGVMTMMAEDEFFTNFPTSSTVN